jgi:hypothetical protein
VAEVHVAALADRRQRQLGEQDLLGRPVEARAGGEVDLAGGAIEQLVVAGVGPARAVVAAARAEDLEERARVAPVAGPHAVGHVKRPLTVLSR